MLKLTCCVTYNVYKLDRGAKRVVITISFRTTIYIAHYGSTAKIFNAYIRLYDFYDLRLKFQLS